MVLGTMAPRKIFLHNTLKYSQSRSREGSHNWTLGNKQVCDDSEDVANLWR